MKQLLVVIMGFLSLAGCATTLRGTHQDVALSSSPTGAIVSVNGGVVGTTPLMVSLPRRDGHVVHMELRGYEPVDRVLVCKPDPTFALNAFTFGVGFAVDLVQAKGLPCTLEPSPMEVTLMPWPQTAPTHEISRPLPPSEGTPVAPPRPEKRLRTARTGRI